MGDRFAIDGTGRVIRRNDRIVVRALSLTGNHGPGYVDRIDDDRCHADVVFDGGRCQAVPVTLIHRADDTERDDRGNPLWSAC